MQFIIIATLALIPLAFLPLTQDMFIPIKWTILVGSALLMIFLCLIRLWRVGSAQLSISRAVIGLSCMSLVALVGLVLASSSRTEAIVDPMGTSAWASWTILLLFGGYAASNKMQTITSWVMTLVACAISLISILQHFLILQNVFPALPFLTFRSWTPLGTITALPWFVLGCVPLLLWLGTNAWHKQNTLAIAILILIGGILATSVSLYAVLPPGDRIRLPLGASWSMTAESFKQPTRALYGIGAENFVTAFTLGRSADLNTTPLWNLRFTQGSSILFHIATTLGLLGIIGLFLIARSFLGSTKTFVTAVGVLVPIAVLLFAPPVLPVFALVLATYLVIHNKNDTTVTLHIPTHLSWLRTGSLLLGIAVVGTAAYVLSRNFLSETIFYRSLKAREANDGRQTYELQIKALEQNPWVVRYRLAYSQTNIDIANAIARSAQQEAIGVNESDRQTIASLIQQSIREAKIAVTLSPNSPITWQYLADLYRSLTRVAQGADQWAVASYQKAITLDPTNPLLRLSYAGLLSELGDTDNAFMQYQTTSILKPDYTAAHYALAGLYRARQQYFQEARALGAALQSVTRGTDDETQIRTELETARARLTDSERTQLDTLLGRTSTDTQSELTSPLPESPQLEPKLNLPIEASPGALPQR